MPRNILEAARRVASMGDAEVELFARRNPDIFRDVARAYSNPFIDPSKTGIFRDHSCYRCKSGELPCIKGKGRERDCDTLHARND